ncbi:MAG: anthrax toxin-like adenylyl cyclase domain-containing protein, partial [Rhodospirillales bacterium]
MLFVLGVLVLPLLGAPGPAEARTPVPREDLLCPEVAAETRPERPPTATVGGEGDKHLPAVRVSSFAIDVAIRDANPLFLAGGDVVTAHDTLPYHRIPGPVSVDHLTFEQLLVLDVKRRGVVADGVSQLLLVLKTTLPGRFAGAIPTGDGRDGTLRFMRNGETCAWKGHHYAFAVYTAPAHFGKPTRHMGARVGRAQARDIGVSLQFRPTDRDRHIRKTISLKLVRPPVILVHGLFDNGVDAWLTPSRGTSTLPAYLDLVGFETFVVDYSPSNGRGEEPSSFQDNRYILWTNGQQDPGIQVPVYLPTDPRSGRDPETDRPVYKNPKTGEQAHAGGIRQALTYFRDTLKIAAARADVIGHSMGGVLARVYASDKVSPTWAADQKTCRGKTKSADPRYLKEPYNPHYRRPDNFGAGDINRLITVGTPHHGSGQTRLFELLTHIKVNNEGWKSYGARTLAKYGVYFLAGVHARSPAMQELKLQSCGLQRIGATDVASHVIVAATRPGGEKDPVHDPSGEYLGTLNYVGGLLYYFPEILDDYFKILEPDWKDNPLWYKQIKDGKVRAALDDLMELEARYWTNLRREIEDYYLDLGGVPKEIQDKYWSFVPKGLDDERRPVERRQLTEEPKVPYVTLEALRALMFRFEKNDSTVRIDSQSAGLNLNSPFVTYIAKDNFEKKHGLHIKQSMLHRHTIRDGRVHRRLARLLRSGPSQFAPSLPPAGQPLPGRKPPPSFSVDWRLSGSFAVKWSGIPFSHAKAIRQAAIDDDAVIMVRPVNPDSTALILQGAATKGMNVKGKSSNWGPQRGYIPTRQRYSKLWRLGDSAKAKIGKFDKKTRALLLAKEPIYKTAKGAPIAIDRQLEHCWPVPCAQAEDDRSNTVTYTVWADPKEADAEAAVYFCKGTPANGDAKASDTARKKAEKPCECGEWYDWRNGPPDPNVPGSTGEFDLKEAPGKRKDPPACERLRPLRVLADNTQKSKPFLTADYDLLATAFFCPKGKDSFHPECKAKVKVEDKSKPKGRECGDSRGYTNATYGRGQPPKPLPCFDPQTGLITEAQKDLLDRINDTVRTVAKYKSGKLSHHGPETNFFGSPYVDYPITVFDPRGPGGKAVIIAIPKGPKGFRDIYLKRYYEKKIRQGYWLYPNTFKEAAWHWIPRGTKDDWHGWYYEDHAKLAGGDDVEELAKPKCVACEVERLKKIRRGETVRKEPVECTPEDKPAKDAAPQTAALLTGDGPTCGGGPTRGDEPADTLALGGGGGGGTGGGGGSGGGGGK